MSGGDETSESLPSLRRGIEQSHDDANGHLLLGTALAEAGQPTEALGHLQRAVALDPALVRGHIRLGNLLRELSRTGEAVEAYGRALEIHPAAPTTFSNLVFAMQYDSGISREEIAAAHWEWGGRFGQALGQADAPARDGQRPLRLGFLSADFRYHPVGRMASALWQNLDRARVTPIVYDNSAADSPAKRRYSEHVAQWQNIATLPDDAVAELIRASGSISSSTCPGTLPGTGLPCWPKSRLRFSSPCSLIRTRPGCRRWIGGSPTRWRILPAPSRFMSRSCCGWLRWRGCTARRTRAPSRAACRASPASRSRLAA